MQYSLVRKKELCEVSSVGETIHAIHRMSSVPLYLFGIQNVVCRGRGRGRQRKACIINDLQVKTRIGGHGRSLSCNHFVHQRSAMKKAAFADGL